jgi:NTE family protein
MPGKPSLRGLLTTTLIIGLLAEASFANDCARAPVVDRPKIGLVLGGGGARGAAHIGVIRKLEEMRIPIDYVTGTSMGALVGSLFATGMRAADLERTVLEIDFGALFKDATDREDLPFRRKRDDDSGLFGPKLGIGKGSQLLPAGAIHGQRISFLFEALTSQRVQVEDFDDLPIPYRALVTDIVTGDPIVLGEGNLALAMRASMSVPGAFDPVQIRGHRLVDGGISNNLPIDVARSLGADVVIAVEVGTPLATSEDLNTILDFTGQLTSLLVVRTSMAQIATLTPEDVLIKPDLGDDIAAASFDKAGEAIPIGYAAADAMEARLARLSVSEAVYAEHRRHIESCVTPLPPVQFVRIDNQSRFDDSIIAERLHIEIGKPVDRNRLERDIQQIYALGFLQLARYEMTEENGQTGVVVHVEQDTRGTSFIEWGIDVFGDGDDSSLNLRLAYLKTDVDRFGSEFRFLTQIGETPAIGAELYKFIDPDMRIVFKPRVFAERRDITIYDNRGNPLEIFEVDQYGGELALLREFTRYAALSIGLRQFNARGKAQTSLSPVDDFKFDGGEYFVNAIYDRLDNRYFPSFGTRAQVVFLRSDSSLNADAEYEQVLTSVLTAYSWDRDTVFGGARYNTTLDSHAPLYALFRAGGFLDLSGLQPDELSGQHYGAVLASYRRNLGGRGLFPAYAGVSAEYGNAGDDRDDVFGNGIFNGSVYLGYESPMGPLYLGMGFAEDGQRSYFLRIGNVLGRSSIGR